MAAINYKDLFDIDGYEKGIRNLEKANQDFGKTVEVINARIAAQYSEIKGELSEFVGLLKTFNVNQKSAADTIIRTGDAAMAAMKKTKEQERVMAELSNTVDLNTASVNELKTGLKGLATEYNGIQGKEEKDLKRKKELVAEIRRLRAALKEQTDALKATKQVLDAAEGSYQALQNEMASIGRQLKAMPDAFDKTTGKINANNKAAVELQQRYLALNGTLKMADSQLGNYQRNVGNYASGFTGLNQSFGQLARELPALGINLQTFFLAISNNLPIFFDQLKQTKTEIAAMRAEGLKAPTMLQAMGKAIFSLSTLLSVGVTLLTLYGKQVIDYIGNLFSAKRAATEFEKNQKQINETFKEAGKSVADDVVKLEAYKNKLNDLSIPASQRVKVAKEYNKVADETNKIDLAQINNLQVINEKIAAQNDLIIQRAISTAALSKLTALSSELVSVQLEIGNALSNAGLTEEQVAEQVAKGVNRQIDSRNSNINSLDGYKKAVTDNSNQVVAAVSKEVLAINALMISRNGKERELQKATKVLSPLITVEGITTPDKEKTKEGKTDAEKLAEDVKKQQEKLKADLQSSLADIADLKADDVLNEEEYQMAKLGLVKQYVDGAIEEEKRLQANASEKNITDLKTELKTAGTEYNKFLKEQSQAKIEQKKKDIDEGAKRDIQNLENEKTQVLLFKDLTDKEREALEIDYQNRVDQIKIKALEARKNLTVGSEAEELQRQIEALENIILLRNKSYDNKQADDAKAKIRKGYEDELSDAEKLFDFLTRGRTATVFEQIAQIKKYYDIKKKLVDNDKDRQRLALEEEKALMAAKLDALQAFSNDIMGVLSENSKARSENRIKELEEQKNREIELAGNNAAAKEAIEKKYQEKIAAEKTKQAKAEKNQAIFKIAIETAIGAARAVAASPVTFGMPFLAFVLLQGALQAAAVASRPLPKYKTGRKGGPAEMAVVDEIGSELILDKHGRIREVGSDDGPRLTQLNQGDSVIPAGSTKKLLKDSETERILREIGLYGQMSGTIRKGKQDEMVNIMTMAMQSGQINQQVLEAAFKKAIKDVPKSDFFLDERGFRKRITEGNSKTTYLNNLTKI